MTITQQTQYWEIVQIPSKRSENVSLNQPINQFSAGCLSQHTSNWEEMTLSQELFQTVREITLDFLEEPLLRYDD